VSPGCRRHVYEQPVAKVGGWYTTEQAGSGEKLYQAQCASCHGAKLEGGTGPALNGTSWHQMYGGAKLLTVWGEIKGPMAQYAGTTYTTQQSLDILSYLLQSFGLMQFIGGHIFSLHLVKVMLN